MKEELLELIYNHALTGKQIDKAFINRLVEIAINGKALNSYVKDIKIKRKTPMLEKNCVLAAQYQISKKRLIFFTQAITVITNYLNKFTYFEGFEKDLYNHLVIVQIILHEIEHANQQRIMETEDTLEQQILRLSTGYLPGDVIMNLLMKGYTIREIFKFQKEKAPIIHENNTRNYAICPHEKLAEIKSNHEILKIISPLSSDFPDLVTIQRDCVLGNMLIGYKNNSIMQSPTLTYLNGNDENKTMKAWWDWYDNDYFTCLEKVKNEYDLTQRLLYGLPISETEHEDVKQLIKIHNPNEKRTLHQNKV